MTEPDVTLSDYGIFIICTVFVVGIKSNVFDIKFHKLGILFYLSIGLAALTGGTVNGFYIDGNNWGYKILWPTTLLLIGLAALCLALLTMCLINPRRASRNISLILLSLFLACSFVILTGFQQFWIAIFFYSPWMIALGITSFIQWTKNRLEFCKYFFFGVVLSGLAALTQLLNGVGTAIQQILRVIDYRQ